jgi:hypothetical protein
MYFIILVQPTVARLAELRATNFFYIFILSRFCKNIWSVTNFAKIYIWRRGPRRQDITSWSTVVGAARSGP